MIKVEDGSPASNVALFEPASPQKQPYESIVEVGVDRRQREQGGTGKIFLFLRTGEEIPLPVSQALPTWQQRHLVKVLQRFLQI